MQKISKLSCGKLTASLFVDCLSFVVAISPALTASTSSIHSDQAARILHCPGLLIAKSNEPDRFSCRPSGGQRPGCLTPSKKLEVGRHGGGRGQGAQTRGKCLEIHYSGDTY